MTTHLSDDFKSSQAHFLGSIISYVKVAIGTGFPSATCMSVCKANREAQIWKHIVFNVYLKMLKRSNAEQSY